MMLFFLLFFIFTAGVSATGIPPAAISNLTALTGSVQEGDIVLTWTAPGDDDTTGTCSTYVVKYATFQITSVLFDSVAVSTYSHAWSGLLGGDQTESRTITGLLGGTTYFFAIKAVDDADNYSVWSSSYDVPGINTANWSQSWKIPPAAVTTLSADTTGCYEGEIRLTWLAPGDDDTTGNITDGEIRIKHTLDQNYVYDVTDFSVELTTDTFVGDLQTYRFAGLIPTATYYFRVWSKDECPNNWSPLSNGATNWAQVDVSPPAPITRIFSVETGFRYVKIRWTAPVEDDSPQPYNTGAYDGKYEIKFASFGITNETLWQLATTYVIISTNTTPGKTEYFAITGLTNGTTYYFSIKTADEGNRWSAVSSTPSVKMIPVNTPPVSASMGFYPQKIISSTTFTFYWSASTATAGSTDEQYGDFISSYTVYLSTFAPAENTIGSSTITITVVHPSSYCSVSNLREDTTYWFIFWTSDSENFYASPWTFVRDDRWICPNSVNSPPRPFVLISSAGIVSYPMANNIGFDWSDATDPDPGDFVQSYSLIISTYTSFVSSLTYTNITASTYTPGGLIENTTHWWFVVAYDSGAPFGYSIKSTSSSAWWIQVNGTNEAPYPFSLVSPTTGQIVRTQTPAFGWQATTDPDPGDSIDYYQIWYSSYLNNPFPSLFGGTDNGDISINAGDTTTYVMPSLVENATYYWGVAALDKHPGFSTTLWSTTTVRYFIVNASSQPPVPVTLYLPSGATKEISPFFDWSDTTDPDPFDYVLYYRLCYSTSPDFAVSITTITSEIYAVNSSTQLPYNLSPRTTYYWNVRAYGNNESAAGNIWSVSPATFSFYTSNNQPNPFDIISPTSTLSSTTIWKGTNIVKFVWENNGDPDIGDTLTYTLLYSSYSNFSVWQSSAGLVVSSVSITLNIAQFENTTCYWKVEARDNFAEVRVSSSTGYFILNAVNSPPSAPALSAPSSGTIVNSSTPTFSWSASSDIDPGDFVLDYTVYYSSNNFITVQSSAGIKKTSFVPTIALVENATYRWNVSARDSEGIFSNISTTWSVIISSVNEIPDPFDLVLPSGTVKTRAPRFVWGPANITEYFETHRYKLNYGFGTSDWTISTETIGSATFYQLSGTGLEVLAENTTYWWEVEAVDSIGQTRKSTQKFYIFISSTNEPPNHFSIISPLESSSINTRTPLLTWQKATDPDEPAGDRILSYTLTYSTSTDFSLPIIHSGITETSWQVPSSEKLLQGATYYWKVTAFDTKGSSATTSVGKFFVLEINKLPPPRYWTRRELLDGGKKFFIEWQQVSRFEDGTTITEPGKEIYGYNVYRSNSPTGTFEKAGATVGYNSYAWTDNSVDGRTYYYLVRTLTPTGLESGDSDMVSSEISPAVVIMSNQKDAHLSISGDLSDKMRINQEKAWLVKDGAECEIRVTKMDSKGVETEQKDYKFGSPVILNFRYTLSLWAGISAQTQQGASPSIFWHNGVEFINLGGIRDTTKGEMSVRINQSGRYKLDTVFEKDFSFSIYPSKIFTPNKDGKWDEIKFNYINRTGEQVSGAVYDLYGGFVSNMASKSDSGDYLSWDGRYQGGEPARKGMYIYQIKYGNRAWTGTIILAR